MLRWFSRKYTVTGDGFMLKGLGKYRVGAVVRLTNEIWATDTDYRFYVDGVPADVSFDNKGYTVMFTMPAHDVKVTVEAHNSMCFKLPE